MNTDPRAVMFVSLPESGLLNPMLVLAAELARRGVPGLSFATDESRRTDIETISGDHPVRFASLGEVVPELSAVTWDDATYRRVTQRSRFKAHRAVIRHTYRPDLQATKFRALAAAVDEIQPELMVIESLCSFAVDLALTRGIPFVLSVPFLPSNVLTAHNPFARSYTPRGFPVPHSGLPARMTPWQRLSNEMFKLRTLAMFFHPAMGRVLSEDARIRKELGLSVPSPMTRVDRAEMVICNSIPELDYPFDIPDKLKLVGALMPPLPEASTDNEVMRWLAAQRSVVYMGFGTITRLSTAQAGALVEVARRLDGTHSVLWRLPSEQQHLLADAGPLPANLRIENWLPSQLDVLAHPAVKVFFTHGGGNGFHEGVYFGKPLVVRPLWVDCFDQAIRGRDAGVSLTLDHPETVDPDDVLDKLNRVLDDPSFTARAAQLGARQREAGGVRAAADLINQVVTR
ncbi:glycosyltransferase [Couchioplanes caeruleus]|uniref:AceD1 n=2 Tax=Couchioplanes caeruleus TaxID=56438 RepID=A0A1K0GUU5_9ACTN|nr:glycosyltransferase [Couchioplanes caeruleus]AGM21646.1 mycosaminyltransferase [Couchioplanes caeruleus]OJF16278.1 AceD1 [Couchioplanes caeruleus subsp. caeruleus]ROP28368.1 polyene glycosyltransferase [Couchioplanes caeruleus]